MHSLQSSFIWILLLVSQCNATFTYHFTEHLIFHRAFDMSNDRDAIKAMNVCIEMGVHRILTSGLQSNVEQGLQCILRMIEHANSRIIIAVCGGINAKNICKIIHSESNGIRHIHGTFRSTVKSNMKYKKLNIYMGAKSVNNCKMNEYQNKYADANMIKQIVSYMNTTNECGICLDICLYFVYRHDICGAL
eukprot:308776_1